MRTRILWRSGTIVLFAVAMTIGGQVSTVLAETSSSNNYQATDLSFGATDLSDTCSGQYCARASIGSIDGSPTSSATMTAEFGPIVDEEQPALDLIVEAGASDLGVLDTEHTATKTTTIRIRNYLSNGYVLQIMGSPPVYSGHMLATPTTPTASTPGTEQFAINLTDNSQPDIGAVPAQVPSSEFSFGDAEDGYKTPNLFKYIEGDTVARSDTESGRTDYTMSMIINVSNNTPAGHYSGDFSAVVIPVY